MAAPASAPANPSTASEANPGKIAVVKKEEHSGDDARWQPVLALPCELVVELPLPNFKVSDFLRLQAESVIATDWRVTRDVPLRANGTLIAWGEFDGSGNRLAVRLTELA